MAKDIFFSYGHDEYKDFVMRVKKYLEDEGFEVFVDNDKLHSGDDWEYNLERGIKQYDKVIFFVTPHSARRPDGYCLNEIAMALANGKKIFPVMVKNYILPLSLIRKQFLDMQACVLDNEDREDSIFSKNMKNLIGALKKNDDFEYGDIQAKVIKKLEPIDFQLNYSMHGRIVGREWIMDKVDDWIENNPESKVLWITADAGYGKSAISAYLSRHPKVMNVHFCDYKGGVKNKPENVIKTLAYSLQQQQIKGYLEEIEYIDLEKKKAFELFEELIVNPLSKVKSENNQYIFVIDGLDETLTNKDSELVKLLGSDEFQWGLPDFIKIIITSRPDPKLRQILSKLNPLVLDTRQIENKKDCEQFISIKLTELLPNYDKDKKIELVERILNNSDANMLYLTKFFEQENINFDKPNNFPKGLDGIYMNFFSRVTDDIDFYDEEYAPILEVMLAYEEVIPKELVRDILGITRKKLHRVLGAFGSMIRDNNDRLEFYHKSLNDWLISEENEDYFVDIDEGKNRLNNFINNMTTESYKESYLSFEYFNKLLIDSIYSKDKNLVRYFNMIEEKGDIHLKIKLINNLGASYNMVNQTQQAIECLEYVLKIEKEVREVNPNEYCKTMEKLSILYWKVNKADESVNLRKTYIEYAENLYAKDDKYAKEYSKSLYLLSSAYVQFSMYKEAEALRKKCLKIREKFYEKDPEAWVELYTTALLGVAGVYRRTDRNKKAIPLGDKVLKIREELYKKDSNRWASVYSAGLQNAAIFYNGIGNTKKAIDFSKEAVKIRQSLFEDNPPRHAATFTVNLSNLSIYFNDIGEHQKALELQNNCLEIREKFYKENPDRWTAYYAGILKQIGITYRHLGELEKSIEYMEKGIALRELVYNKAPDRWVGYYASALASLAKTYRKAKRFDKALMCGEKALNFRKDKYLKDKEGGIRSYILSLETLSRVYIDMNQLDEAKKYAQLNYDLCKQHYMKNNTSKWKKYYASGLLTLSQTVDDINFAIELIEESVKLREELYNEYGNLRKYFYIKGLKELIFLYEKDNMINEKKFIEEKLRKIKQE